MSKIWSPVINVFRQIRDCAIASVTCEVHWLTTWGNGPRSPQCGCFIKRSTRRCMLTREAWDSSLNIILVGWLDQCEIDVLPPVELDSVLDAAVCEPLFETLWDTKLGRRVMFLDVKDSGVRKMIVMRVAYDNLLIILILATSERRRVKEWLTQSMIGISEMSQGLDVSLLWPIQENGEQRSSNTGSKRNRRPVGNSTK